MAVSISTGPGGMTNDFGEVIEVEVNRETGHVRVTHVTAAITAGLIINPDSVTQQVEGNTILGISQALKEERMFDEQKVTSVDWVTYPILRFTDAPDEIDVLLFNNPHPYPGIASELNGIPAPQSVTRSSTPPASGSERSPSPPNASTRHSRSGQGTVGRLPGPQRSDWRKDGE